MSDGSSVTLCNKATKGNLKFGKCGSIPGTKTGEPSPHTGKQKAAKDEKIIKAAEKLSREREK